MNALVDNDVLFKGACYRLLSEFVSAIPCDTKATGVLGSAQFVLRRRIRMARLRSNVSEPLRCLMQFLADAQILEPTDGELQMAANLELMAQTLRVNLDSGESQLSAVLVTRNLPVLLTGDKRAIQAIEILLDADARLQAACGRIKCLEQIVKTLLSDATPTTLRAAICGEPDVDKALSICFSCKNPDAGPDSFLEGLTSYINSLRASARRVLAL